MKKTKMQVQLADVQKAKQDLKNYIYPSPLLYNAWLSEKYNCEIYLKLECMQPIGSFKIRGATNKILNLSKAERKRGVIAASAGNHAQGVAWGAKKAKVKALIVMPKSAPLVKIKNTLSLGAEVILEGENYDEAFAYAKKLAKKKKMTFVHAFDDKDVISGQGTVALEILDELPDLDCLVCSIGGGGLLAGISTVMKSLKPNVKLYGSQAEGAAAMVASFKKNKPVKLSTVSTFADGIAVSTVLPSTFFILKDSLNGIYTANDEMIAESILTLVEKAKVISEGAAAVSIAVLEQLREKIKNKKVVVVICGGNIDVNVLNRIIDRGLIRQGRRLRVNVHISDKPGSLARLTAVVAQAGANVIQAIHDRSEPAITIDKTEVALTLETKGPEHTKAVIDLLKKNVQKIVI